MPVARPTLIRWCEPRKTKDKGGEEKERKKGKTNKQTITKNNCDGFALTVRQASQHIPFD